jgi:hypothetical protein
MAQGWLPVSTARSSGETPVSLSRHVLRKGEKHHQLQLSIRIAAWRRRGGDRPQGAATAPVRSATALWRRRPAPCILQRNAAEPFFATPATIPMHAAARPPSDEYAPFYGRYIALVPEREVVEVLEEQATSMQAILATVPAARENYRYAPDRWSIREVVGHLADTERIMACRALRIARGDQNPLPGFDENAYVTHAAFDRRTLSSLGEELLAVRRASVALFGSLAPEAWARRGIANDAPVSVRALAYIIAGHELHHRRILAERYLVPERREP